MLRNKMAADKLGFEIYALTTIPERADVAALDLNHDFNLEAIEKDAEKTSSRTRATTFPRPHAPRSQDDETRHEFNDAEDDDDRVGT